MGRYEANGEPWWRRFLRKIEGREPVVIRGAITAAVAGAAVWGADIADVGERLEQTLDIVGGFLVAAGVAWQRAGAVPAREVLVQRKPDGEVVRGPGAAPVDIP